MNTTPHIFTVLHIIPWCIPFLYSKSHLSTKTVIFVPKMTLILVEFSPITGKIKIAKKFHFVSHSSQYIPHLSIKSDHFWEGGGGICISLVEKKPCFGSFFWDFLVPKNKRCAMSWSEFLYSRVFFCAT